IPSGARFCSGIDPFQTFRCMHTKGPCGDTMRPTSATCIPRECVVLKNAVLDRKLAAVLAAKRGGYSALMARDGQAGGPTRACGRASIFAPIGDSLGLGPTEP